MNKTTRLLTENNFKETYSVNFFKDKLYLGSDIDGLRFVNIITGETIKLSEKSPASISILDDKYVYFTDEADKLFRVTNDGKTENTIF